VALARQGEQFGVGQTRDDVLAVGEGHDVVGVAMPPAHRHLHLFELETPVLGEHGDVGERRGQLLAAAVEQVVEEHRPELRPQQETPVGFR
jgi:hypothetical protein